jgi:hypothetical protein
VRFLMCVIRSRRSSGLRQRERPAYNICADTTYPISEFIRILEKLTN